MDKKNAGYYAKLFYHNAEKNVLEYIAESVIGEDGMVTLPFNHASDYVIVIDEEPTALTDEEVVEEETAEITEAEEQITSTEEVETEETAAVVEDEPSDSTETTSCVWKFVVAGVILLIVVVGAVTVFLKKKQND